MTQRLTYLDLASGIMIVWLLFFHALYPMLEHDILLNVPFFYFFMPWFFFKSGMMFEYRECKSLAKKDTRKLLKAFAIWSLIGYVAHILWHWLFYNDLTLRVAFYSPARSFLLGSSIPMNNALWFIPILFCIRQLFNRGGDGRRLNSVAMAIIGLVIAISCSLINFRLMPSWISATAWGLFFFAMGYALKNLQWNKWIAIASVIILIVSYFTIIPTTYSEDNPTTLKYAIWLIACVFACIAFNNICQLLLRPFSESNQHNAFPALQYVGRHSMIYYCGHYIIFRISFDSIAAINPEWYSTWQGLLITFIAYGIILTTICIFRKH